MKNILYRIAMQSLNEDNFEGENIAPIENIEKAFVKALDLIKENKIKDTKKLFAFLDHVNVSKKDFENYVTKQFRDEENNINKILNIA